MVKNVKLDKLKNGECFLDLKHFQDLLDISKVKYYDIKPTSENNLSILFYDKDKNLIPLKEKS